MQISYFPKQTAQLSEPIWQAFLNSCKKNGIEPVENSMNADFALIWSVLWQGKMLKNQQVLQHYEKLGKPVFIIEVGSLLRGQTWKIALKNITRQGLYANESNFIPYRDKKLGIFLSPYNTNRPKTILLALQHEKSLQWTNIENMYDWASRKIAEIRQFCDYSIIVRPHPRCNIGPIHKKNVFFEMPSKIPNTYDKFNINYDHTAVVNFNSGVGIQSILLGTPIICDFSSLAYEVSNKIEHLPDPQIPDRELWFRKILHTEWTVEEIEDGIPLKRLLSIIDLT